MPSLARRNLFHDKVRLSVTLTGVIFAVVLIIVQLGLCIGFAATTSNISDHSGADFRVAANSRRIFNQPAPVSESKFYQALAVPGGAAERHSFVDDQALEEDRAEADVALARAPMDEARTRLDKTFIGAPLDGMILRRHLKNGESLSDMGDMPIVTMVSLDKMCVRMDVDETDIDRIQIGQQAFVKADAFGAEKFDGRVVRIGQIPGKKNVRTDEPSERADTKILETLIELEDGKKLSPGLCVDSLF
jgi:HlyD family secretion protein